MAATNLATEVSGGPELRGPAVWIGCDAFGAEIIAGLDRRLNSELTARRLVRLISLVSSAGEHEGEGQAGVALADDLSGAALDAIGALLAETEVAVSRQTSPFVPAFWACFDAAAASVEGVVDGLAELLEELNFRAIPARLFLLARNVTWDQRAKEREAINASVRTMLAALSARDKPGHGRTQIFVVSDFGPSLKRYLPHELTEASLNFSEWVILTDAVNSANPPVVQAFSPRVSGGGLHERVFATFGAVAVEFPVEQTIQHANDTRLRMLSGAMQVRAPDAWAPTLPPEPRRPELAGAGTLQPLRLPRWRPRYRASAEMVESEFDIILEDWLSNAEAWRRRELTTCFERRDAILTDSDWAKQEYVQGLETGIRLVLRDASVPGFFSPLRSYLTRCQSDLEVRLFSLGPTQEFAPASTNKQLMSKVASPATIVAQARDELGAMVERRANPYTVALVAILSTVIGAIWLYFLILWFPQTLLYSAISWLAPVGSQVAGNIARQLVNIRDWRLVDPMAAKVWIAAILFGYLTVVLLSIFLRERHRQEQVFQTVYQRIRRWRSAASSVFADTLLALQDWRYRDNIERAERTVSQWLERLANAEDQLARATTSDAETRQRFRASIQLPAPNGLTERQVQEVVAEVRDGIANSGRLPESGAELEKILVRTAARIAKDHELDLPRLVPSLMDQIRDIVPGERGLLLRPVSPAESRQHWASYEFYGAPSGIAEVLAAEFGEGSVLLTSDRNRVLAISIRTGLSADEVFR